MSGKLPWNVFRWDANADGIFTVSDIWELAVWLFYWPGNAALSLIEKYVPKIARFFEIDISSQYGGFAVLISIIAWFFILFFISDIIDQSNRGTT